MKKYASVNALFTCYVYGCHLANFISDNAYDINKYITTLRN